MHTNKTKEEDAVISDRLCGFQLENKVMSILEKKTFRRPFWLCFRRSWKFYFKSCKILIYLYLFFLKSIHFCMFIIQNSSKAFTYKQILSFLENSPRNLEFSYILRLSPLCMNEEKWKKSQEIKFYWDLFSNSVDCKDKKSCEVSTQAIRYSKLVSWLPIILRFCPELGASQFFK